MSARTVAEIDWNQWRANEPATLLFVVKDGQILLIRKKRGLGAGKINGPGGRLEDGESLLECAVRETREELLITPTGLSWAGENRFQFTHGYSIHVHAFRATGYTGIPTETDEAIPLWFPLDALPFDDMWEDDYLWLPMMLRNEPFSGMFIFDGDRMLDYKLERARQLPSI